jgi:hypothetical protein
VLCFNAALGNWHKKKGRDLQPEGWTELCQRSTSDKPVQVCPVRRANAPSNSVMQAAIGVRIKQGATRASTLPCNVFRPMSHPTKDVGWTCQEVQLQLQEQERVILAVDESIVC